MLRTALRYGFISGAIIVGISSLTFSIMSDPDFAYGELLGYATMLVALSMVYFGIRKHRQEQEGERLSFGQGVQVGLLITLVASTIYVAAWMIYYSSGGGQEMMNAYFEHQVEQYQQSDMPAEEVDAKIAELDGFRESYANPLVRIGFTFLEIFPVGLLVTLLASWLLRKPEEPVRTV